MERWIVMGDGGRTRIQANGTNALLLIHNPERKPQSHAVCGSGHGTGWNGISN
jgi:hypothetical protein